jgi:plasmid stabilization system protein ParE
MGLQIVAKKRFLNSFKRITSYLKKEWGKSIAVDFNKIVINKLDLLTSQPNIGADTAIKKTKSILVGKGY